MATSSISTSLNRWYKDKAECFEAKNSNFQRQNVCDSIAFSLTSVTVISSIAIIALGCICVLIPPADFVAGIIVVPLLVVILVSSVAAVIFFAAGNYYEGKGYKDEIKWLAEESKALNKLTIEYVRLRNAYNNLPPEGNEEERGRLDLKLEELNKAFKKTYRYLKFT